MGDGERCLPRDRAEAALEQEPLQLFLLWYTGGRCENSFRARGSSVYKTKLRICPSTTLPQVELFRNA